MSTKILIQKLQIEIQCALLERVEEWRQTPVVRGVDGRFASESGRTSPESEVIKGLGKDLKRAEKSLKELESALTNLPQESYDRIKELLDLKNMEKARDAILSEFEKVDPSKAKALADSVDKIEVVIKDAQTPEELILELERIRNDITQQINNKNNVIETLGFGLSTVASGVLLGPFGVVMAIGGYGALKTFSIPNLLQEGGKVNRQKIRQDQEKSQQKNSKPEDFKGLREANEQVKAYLSGGASNLTFNVCVQIAALGAIALVVEIADPKKGENLPWKGSLVELIHKAESSTKLY